MIRHLILCSFFSFSNFALASDTIAITNAHIYSMGKAGEVKQGTIIVKDGKIRTVGTKVEIPANAHIIDGKGRIVTPGFIMIGTTLGADEIPGVPSTIDSGVNTSPMSAAFDIQYGINPHSTLLPIARMSGGTAAVATPRFNQQGPQAQPRVDRLFAGHAALISLATSSDLVLKAKIAMALPAGSAGAANAGGGRGAFFVRLRGQIEEARTYLRNREAYNQKRLRDLSLSIDDLEALVPVVEGREPILVDANRASDIRQLLAFARKEKVRLVISGAAEAWLVAGEIAVSKTPVLLDSLENLPRSFDTLASTLENASRLNAAKVSISILTTAFLGGTKGPRLAAGIAVSHGLPWKDALAALTINPARAFGVADRIGSLDPGKSADLVIWNGDPLETSGFAEIMLIKGEEQPLISRQTLLRDRYLWSR